MSPISLINRFTIALIKNKNQTRSTGPIMELTVE